MYGEDELKLKQILINLITNAIKFTEEGFITISLNCENINKTEIRLLLSVEDSGIGVAEDETDSIFEQFEQGDATEYSRRYGGMGLGLSICKYYLNLMQGKIFLESIQGKGSTFFVELPLKISDTSSQKTVDDLEIDLLQFRDKYILVVEDNLINQKVMSIMLQQFGINFDIASTGERGSGKGEK